MLTKKDLQNLLGSVEIAQRAGQIPPASMVVVGAAYQNGLSMLEKMQDGDMLVMFTAKKNDLEPGESGEQSQPEAELKPAPKKGK